MVVEKLCGREDDEKLVKSVYEREERVGLTLTFECIDEEKQGSRARDFFLKEKQEKGLIQLMTKVKSQRGSK